MESLDELVDAGLLIVTGDRITLTTSGRPFVRLAAAAFDAYLHSAKKQHSIAV
jgi:oxygen-independent coproporphyrinogen-3 oxidase